MRVGSLDGRGESFTTEDTLSNQDVKFRFRCDGNYEFKEGETTRNFGPGHRTRERFLIWKCVCRKERKINGTFRISLKGLQRGKYCVWTSRIDLDKSPSDKQWSCVRSISVLEQQVQREAAECYL